MDGYKLTLHRVVKPHSGTLSDQMGQKKKAVLVAHGILNSSADWVLQDRKKSLGMDWVLIGMEMLTFACAFSVSIGRCWL